MNSDALAVIVYTVLAITVVVGVLGMVITHWPMDDDDV
jgi:hypothetical protein